MRLPQADRNALGKPLFGLKVYLGLLDLRIGAQGQIFGLGNTVTLSAVVAG